jgi:hypothetical protein
MQWRLSVAPHVTLFSHRVCSCVSSDSRNKQCLFLDTTILDWTVFGATLVDFCVKCKQLQISTNSFVMPVCPPPHITAWKTNWCEKSYLDFFLLKRVDMLQFWLKSTNNPDSTWRHTQIVTILVTRFTMITSSPKAAMFTLTTVVAWILTLQYLL